MFDILTENSVCYIYTHLGRKMHCVAVLRVSSYAEAEAAAEPFNAWEDDIKILRYTVRDWVGAYRERTRWVESKEEHPRDRQWMRAHVDELLATSPLPFWARRRADPDVRYHRRLHYSFSTGDIPIR